MFFAPFAASRVPLFTILLTPFNRVSFIAICIKSKPSNGFFYLFHFSLNCFLEPRSESEEKKNVSGIKIPMRRLLHKDYIYGP